MAVKVVSAPDDGVWRVGRSPDPIYLAEPVPADLLDDPRLGNRFDSPTGDYRVCYFATRLEGCYGETLARFRPDPGLAEFATDEGHMGLGEVPQDWRMRRLAVRVRFGTSPRLPNAQFLDVESLDTRRILRRDLAPLLALYGYNDLDVPTVRGADRRITRWISKWAFGQRDENNVPLYAGIRYLSRLSSDWECWAVFQDVPIEELERRPVLREDPALRATAHHYDLTLF